MKKLLLALVLFLSGVSKAHEMTPTYPSFTVSHVEGVQKTSLEMFNRRKDVQYYEIGVFDSEWNNVPFVSTYSIYKLEYLGHIKFEVYVNNSDVKRVEYICSKSKLMGEGQKETMLSSRICSRIKR